MNPAITTWLEAIAVIGGWVGIATVIGGTILVSYLVFRWLKRLIS